MQGYFQSSPAVLKKVLKSTFGFDEFRSHQMEIIQNVLRGRDVLAVLATGSGKSLCYQLPAIVSKKPVVVITPLISLMKDQVEQMRERGISAIALNSFQETCRFKQAMEGEFLLLYLSPEMLLRWLPKLKQMAAMTGLTAIAIDESHCISSWGHDFRQAYRKMSILRSEFPQVPIIAVTATATPKVQLDIVNNLELRNPFRVVSSFDRPNLFYEVKNKKQEMSWDIKRELFLPGRVIVYCLRRAECEKVAEYLSQTLNISALPYHAGLPPKQRTKTQKSFHEGETRICVATIAFGMGIDLGNIRTIVHYGIPKSLASYVQQVGRAGRDGAESKCILFWSTQDFSIDHIYFGTGDNKRIVTMLQKIRDYVNTIECRRKVLLEHFGEKYKPPCNKCDNCLGKVEESAIDLDFTSDARILCTCVWECGEKFGLGQYCKILMGSNCKAVEDKARMYRVKDVSKMKSRSVWKHRVIGRQSRSKEFIFALARALITSGALVEKVPRGSKYRIVKLGASGHQLVNNPTTELLNFNPSKTLLDEKLKLRRRISRSSRAGARERLGGVPHATSIQKNKFTAKFQFQRSPNPIVQTQTLIGNDLKESPMKSHNQAMSGIGPEYLSPFAAVSEPSSMKEDHWSEETSLGVRPRSTEPQWARKKRRVSSMRANSIEHYKVKGPGPMVQLVYQKKGPESKAIPQTNELLIEEKAEEFDPNSTLTDQENALLTELKARRLKDARRLGMPPFRLVRNEVLERLVRYRPSTKQTLRQVPNVPGSFFPHVSVFLILIIKFCRKNNLKMNRGVRSKVVTVNSPKFTEPDPIAFIPANIPKHPLPKMKKVTITTDAEKTYQLFNEGKSISEIVQVRHIRRETIETHLQHMIIVGRKIDWKMLKISRAKISRVYNLISEFGMPDDPSDILTKPGAPEDLTSSEVAYIISRYIAEHCKMVPIPDENEVSSEISTNASSPKDNSPTRERKTIYPLDPANHAAKGILTKAESGNLQSCLPHIICEFLRLCPEGLSMEEIKSKLLPSYLSKTSGLGQQIEKAVKNSQLETLIYVSNTK